MTVFDIVGPIMIGPSSSHTAGAARIGRIAGTLLGSAAVEADILLHGSFAKTYKGHGTDKALIAGILGMLPDDPRIKNSPELAEQAGLKINITTGEIDGAHPNTACIALRDAQGREVTLQGASIGGGNLLVTNINGLAVEITGQYPTLIVLHRDAPGTIAAVTNCMGENGVNICNFHLSREEKGGTAVMTIEVDGKTGETLNDYIKKLPNVLGSTLLQPI